MPASPPTRRRILTALGTGFAAGLAGCSTDTPDTGTDYSIDWPMAAGEPGGTSYARDGAAPRKSAEIQWTQPIGYPAGRPTITNGLVFAPAVDALHAFDLETGAGRWRFEPGETIWPTPPAVEGETAYVGMRDDPRFIAIRTDDGSVRWTASLDASVTTPPVLYPGDGQVYLGTESGRIYAIEMASGAIRWRASIGGRLTALCLRPPMVFAGTEGGDVVALEWKAGESIWGHSLDGRIQAIAVGDGDQVFASTAAGTMARLSGGSDRGEPVWINESGPVARGSLVLTRNFVIGTDGDGIKAIGRDRGRTRWTVDGNYSVAPAAAADTVYVGSSSSFEAYRLDGGVGIDGFRVNARRWQHPVDGKPVDGLALAGGMFFGVVRGDEEAVIVAVGPV